MADIRTKAVGALTPKLILPSGLFSESFRQFPGDRSYDQKVMKPIVFCFRIFGKKLALLKKLLPSDNNPKDYFRDFFTIDYKGKKRTG